MRRDQYFRLMACSRCTSSIISLTPGSLTIPGRPSSLAVVTIASSKRVASLCAAKFKTDSKLSDWAYLKFVWVIYFAIFLEVFDGTHAMGA